MRGFPALLAIALLAGGLAVLVLDLGRPERLIVAMTTYNFKSIFAWNIYLYSGFVLIVAAYLFTMMDRRASPRAARQGHGRLAFVWRFALTTGTGSIFGFLIAREAYARRSWRRCSSWPRSCTAWHSPCSCSSPWRARPARS